MTPSDHRRERHVAYLERLLDNTLKELEQHKNAHQELQELKREFIELSQKYNILLDSCLKLEKSYINMLSLVNKGGELQ